MKFLKEISLIKKLILSTQVGRGGGKWLVDILNHCENVRAFGERNRSESSVIYRYNCSHLRKKPSKKLIKLIKSEILTDWEIKDVSYISRSIFFSWNQSIGQVF